MSTNTTNDFNPEEWLSLAEAARLVPSPRAGKKTHLATVYRWARKYGWDVRRRHGFLFIRKEELFALFQAEAKGEPPPPSRQQRKRQEEIAWADKVLREAGLV